MQRGFKHLVTSNFFYKKLEQHFEPGIRKRIEPRMRKRITERVRNRVESNFFEKQLAPFVDYGHITFSKSSFLIDLVQSLKAEGPIIEIGTLFGYSTRMMALAKTADRPLITVDNYVWNPSRLSREQHIEITQLSLKELVDHANVKVIVQDKGAFYESYEGPAPSLVFLDADHSYEETKKDIDWAKSANAGVICGHDYKAEHEGVIRAVEESGGCAKRVESLWVLAS